MHIVTHRATSKKQLVKVAKKKKKGKEKFKWYTKIIFNTKEGSFHSNPKEGQCQECSTC